MLREIGSGYRSALLAHALWGLAPVFWKLLDHVPAAQLTAWRFVQTLAVMVLVQRVARGRTIRGLVASRASVSIHVAAVALLTINWLAFVYAVSAERIVELSLGYFLAPLVSVLLGVGLFRERLSRPSWLAVGLSSVGVAVLAAEAGSLPWIALAVATAFGSYGALQKASEVDAVDGLTIEMLLAAPIAAAYLAWSSITGGVVTGGAVGIGATALIGVVTAAPLLLFVRAARSLPLWALGLLQYVGPSLQLLLGAVVFGETTSRAELVAFAVIWLGLGVFTADRWLSPRAPRTRRYRWRSDDPRRRSRHPAR
ncbi:MAG: EamA family transporter RarD [Actinomycetota bacterium]